MQAGVGKQKSLGSSASPGLTSLLVSFHAPLLAF